ncbi:MAG: VWA domain-containing protein [Clostridia bacterium]|nr:VWA domain-containing protein [Clostridia bacterium]
MKQLTNIYILLDNSYQMARYRARVYENVLKIQRTLRFLNVPTKLHVWQYNDKPQVWRANCVPPSSGNPDLGEALKMLKNVIVYERKYERQSHNNTRSIFLLFTGEHVLRGWERPLKELFDITEFGLGLRYVVNCGYPDNYTKRAHIAFVDNPERIVRHFSESRMCSLVRALR